MDPELVRKYVRTKKKTIWGTFILLIILTFQFYYLNCYVKLVSGYCELSLLFLILALIVAYIGIYFRGEVKSKKGNIEAIKNK
jgi:hypothetical protein